MELSPVKTQTVENVVVDEANNRTYVLLAPRVLSDGEMYKAIRQEILRRGGNPLGSGQTLRLTLTGSGFVASGSSVESSKPTLPSSGMPSPSEAGGKHGDAGSSSPA